ncbi:MAG: dihydrofolate reductase, partial [Prolixibacteraceae bacterium]|nr:dihydrofolate reductase [Prolixibacteraceae bacterium]
KIDFDLHKEVLNRYEKLNLAPYSGFVNPVYVVTSNPDGQITNIQLDYSEGYAEQMMRYSKQYSYLPVYN